MQIKSPNLILTSAILCLERPGKRRAGVRLEVTIRGLFGPKTAHAPLILGKHAISNPMMATDSNIDIDIKSTWPDLAAVAKN
jgi:hypothetical protein